MINEVVFKLELPKYWRIHNAFHISLMKKYQGPEPTKPVLEDPLEIEKLEEILQPEQIVHHIVHGGPQGKRIFKFLVKIKNYLALNAEWMDKDMLYDHPKLVDAYQEAFQMRIVNIGQSPS